MFQSQIGQIGRSVANGLPPLQHFFKRSCVFPGAMTRRWGPQTRYTPRRNAASAMKDFDLIDLGGR